MPMGNVARMLRRWSCLGKGENVQYLEEIILRLEARCREPLKITWEEPLALAVPRTSSWESTQPGRVGSLSVSGVLHSEADVECDPFAALAVFP